MRDTAAIPGPSGPQGHPAPGQQPDGDARPPEVPARSLVAVSPLRHRPDDPYHRPRPSAVFLAHLIATAQQAPQTRARRRAEPKDASAHYASADRNGAASRMLGWSI